MVYEPINKSSWEPYFNLISKLAIGRWVQLEVIGEDVGDQIEKDWVQFDGVSYDPPRDTLFLHTRTLEHEIVEPREIISQRDGTTNAIIVKDRDGKVEIIHFRDPLLLEGY